MFYFYVQIEEVAALRNIIQKSDIHSLVEDRYGYQIPDILIHFGVKG